jgi:hypothetical protein
VLLGQCGADALQFGCSSWRINLPTNCIWRRLPSKLVMRLGSASASRSLSGRPSRSIGSWHAGQQVGAQFLQLGAFALEVGAAGRVAALELALEFQIEFAAFGNEVTRYEIAFFEFACHKPSIIAADEDPPPPPDEITKTRADRGFSYSRPFFESWSTWPWPTPGAWVPPMRRPKPPKAAA